MANKKKGSTWAQKAKVQFKMLIPTGVMLSPGETATLADIYKNDAQLLEKNQNEVEEAIRATDISLRVSNTLSTARAARSQAVGTFKITKDPIKKREWARRIVVADNTIQAVRGAKTRLTATKDRLTMIKGDLELQLIEANTKAAEMQAYASAGNSLRLAGEKLMHARSRASKLSLEYDNLEITMEGAESLMSDVKPEQLVAKAQAVIDRGIEDDIA